MWSSKMSSLAQNILKSAGVLKDRKKTPTKQCIKFGNQQMLSAWFKGYLVFQSRNLRF